MTKRQYAQFFARHVALIRNMDTLFGLSLQLQESRTEEGEASMRIGPALSFAASGLALFCFAGAAHADRYSKAVQKACGADYHKYCGDYGLESAALRVCMDKAGNSLSKGCVNALVQSGEVSQAEVNRRKAANR